MIKRFDASEWKIFQLGVLARVAFFPVAGSVYLKQYFVPFLDAAVTHLGTNPWTLNPPENFPYGSILFLILFIPKWLGYLVFGDASLGTGIISLALIKTPLLILETGMFLILSSFAQHQKRLLLFFWLNPIGIYITYYYGQFDVASMFFLVASIYYLVNEYLLLSAVFFAMATLSKFHVIAVIPILLAYLWNQNFRQAAVRKISSWVGVWIGLTFCGFLPILFANRLGYITMSSPEALRIFQLKLNLGDDHFIYLGFSIVLIVLSRLIFSRRIGPNALLYGSGIVFGCILLVTSPFPGWYLWFLPFVCLFFSTYSGLPRLLFAIFCVSYFAYFLVVEPPYLEIHSLFAGIAFSVLQSSLFGILLAMWIFVISRDAPIVQRFKPLLIGISGDSGAGKNYLSHLFLHVYGENTTQIIEGDDYHRWQRGHQSWNQFTHLDPRANHLSRFVRHLKALTNGLPIHQAPYDHNTGNFGMPRDLLPAKTMIVQGLHVLYPKHFRARFDLKIFLDPEEEVRVLWKVNRDTTQRTQSREQVMEQIERRAPDSKKFIQPQQEFADWIIRARLESDGDGVQQVQFQHIFWNDTPILDVLPILEQLPCKLVTEQSDRDLNRIVIQMLGNPSSDEISKVAHQIFSSLRHVTGAVQPPMWAAGQDGFCQLIGLISCEYRRDNL